MMAPSLVFVLMIMLHDGTASQLMARQFKTFDECNEMAARLEKRQVNRRVYFCKEQPKQ